ncbi:DEAD/DEAH box helicase [Rhodococcus sp. X156]|uniref:DEAD/DEAH box helicase n=1 Tax=Rhodococcus sp. X156 TaxID=2499145 RepID=UPI0019D31F44|nr:DEAD/DEAH box helicase [Rhodococcus sp. X156]
MAEFSAGIPFELDPFQVTACEALEDGHGVLVCAPTGAGKTIVGEFAVHLALAGGTKCFYTTPIKALSNQKYADLVERHGKRNVGLLTGDTSINSGAPVVVMTTEVLRNMLYADSESVRDLSYVVMDEVHYLADRFRGAVWEEVILHLPPEIAVVGLSATVSNSEEFGEWISTVRGDTTVVVDEHRPVPLWQHVMVGRQLFDLFNERDNTGDRKLVVNPDLVHHVQQRERREDAFQPRHQRGRQAQRARQSQRGGYRQLTYRPLPRPEVIAKLDSEGLLPAITFIFSRAGCDAAVTQCVRSGMRLTTEAQAAEIAEIISRHAAELPEADLAVLGFWEWREALMRGFAAHHAGMLPAFKQAVEELFVRGLVRAVFATETLALGINMPARTVVLERLVKYNGESHADLTPGEYTQLTGRAGRRGIDIEGHAVVLWQPGVQPTQVAGLASNRTFRLRSSFRPSYNMTVNLVAAMGPDSARMLLERSFAQFQADRSVVGLSRTIDRNTEAMAGYREQMECHLGDFASYAELRAKITDRERRLAKQGSAARRHEAEEALQALRRGDVIAVPGGRRAGLAVVLDTGPDDADPRPLVLTEDRWAGRLSAADFPTPAEVLGRLTLPRRVEHQVPRVRRDLASTLRASGITAPGRVGKRRTSAADDAELAALRRALRAHPCHGCEDRENHARWSERYARLAAETEKLRQQVAATTHSLARSFDRIRALLAERGYLEGTGPDQEVSKDGRRLERIYSESDLLVAECLRRGVWESLNPAELAAVVSAVVFESRRETESVPRVPAGSVSTALADTTYLWDALTTDERRHKLAPTREPDLGFAWPVYRWARGESLTNVLAAAGENGQLLSAGDFVRWCRQVVDLLDQVRVASAGTPMGAVARDAVAAVRRGVVALGTS